MPLIQKPETPKLDLAILLIPFALAAITFPITFFQVFGDHPIGFFLVLAYTIGVYFLSVIGCSIIGVIIKPLIRPK